jgi:hypothetical protein
MIRQTTKYNKRIRYTCFDLAVFYTKYKFCFNILKLIYWHIRLEPDREVKFDLKSIASMVNV